MKKRMIAFLLLLCMCIVTSCTAEDIPPTNGETAAVPENPVVPLSFSDVSADTWYAPAVDYCREQGLMTGVSDVLFAPEDTLTRAMVVTILYRAENQPAPAETVHFTDVLENSWYASAVAWAEGEQIVQGYGDGRFGPDDPVTQEQLSIILQRYRDDAVADVLNPASKEHATRAEVAVALYALFTGEQLTPDTGSNILVAYFSATGTTKSAAETIQSVTGGDLFEIVPDTPYTSADLNYANDSCRANQEQQDDNARPAIAADCVVANMDSYDVVFLGYPIWWGIPPKIARTFLESYDFGGKTIVPFCTSGGSAFSASGLTELAPDAVWAEGRRLNETSQQAVAEWIDGLHLNTEAETGMNIVVKSSEAEIVFALNDSPAASALAAQLPLTLEVQPFSSNEQTFYPPQALDVTDTPAITSAQAGTLAYYAPWQDVVMFYEGFTGGSGGLYELGTVVSGGDAIRGLSGTITISLR